MQDNENIGFFDTHCHLTDKLYSEMSVSEILRESRKSNVSKFISVGVSYSDSLKALNLATTHSNVYCSIGIHPNVVAQNKFLTPKIIDDIRNRINIKKFIAIGETGLDYYRTTDINKQKNQRTELIKHIELSIELNRPLIIHIRGKQNAHDDLITILKQYPNSKGLIHCFNTNVNNLKKYLDLGFYISIGGIITFDNAPELKKIIPLIPLDKLLLETDAPYLCPSPNRGKLNFPKYISFVAKIIAKYRNLSINDVAKITFSNAQRLFNL